MSEFIYRIVPIVTVCTLFFVAALSIAVFCFIRHK
jgi:hypothetical protein